MTLSNYVFLMTFNWHLRTVFYFPVSFVIKRLRLEHAYLNGVHYCVHCTTCRRVSLSHSPSVRPTGFIIKLVERTRGYSTLPTQTLSDISHDTSVYFPTLLTIENLHRFYLFTFTIASLLHNLWQ